MSFLFISICLIWKKAKKQKPLIRKKESGNNNRNTVMLYACGYACVTYMRVGMHALHILVA